MRTLARRVAACLIVFSVLVPAAPSRAQTVESPYSVRLVAQPLWHERDADLDLRLEVGNASAETLEGFRLSFAAFDRVQSRSELAQSLTIDPGSQFAPSSYTRDFEIPLPPGGTRIVEIDDPVATLVTLGGATESGVYPLAVTLLGPASTEALATMTTQIIYYPDVPETRLNIVTVLPLTDIPSRAPDGTFTAPVGVDTIPIESALADTGWLTSTLSALRKRVPRGFHLALAPTPLLIAELDDLADGYRRRVGNDVAQVVDGAAVPTAAAQALDDIRRIIHGPNVQAILAPYSWPDLPALSSGKLEVLSQQLTHAERALATLGAKFTRRWILPPAGRLDQTTLGRMRDIQLDLATRSFFSDGSLQPPPDPTTGCPEGSPSLTCPIVSDTPDGRVAGYLADPVLQERLGAIAIPGDDRLDLQRFLAETAMIREELPGRAERVIQVTIPPDLHGAPRLVGSLFKGLATAPWLASQTPNEGLHLGAELMPRELVDELRPAVTDPGESYFAAIEEAGELVESFGTIGPPEDLLSRLRDNILVAYSRTWWTTPDLQDSGLSYASESAGEAEEHLDKIRVLGAPEITMTSREGDIQLFVTNDNSFPVTVAIRVTSLNLDIEEGGVIQDEFAPGKTTPLLLRATAQTSGLFPVEVVVETPVEGRVIFGPEDISVRSTELNQVALGITLGAFGFLVLYYALRAFRRRDHQGSGGDPAEEMGATAA
ncbi:MAG TPA: DUF6049 family protein [Actinomycetota bacterium]|nr:DUF6049 family protein [Actinomycetota bacterium]